MNAIETPEPDLTLKTRRAAAEWERLIFEGERHMLRGDYQNARLAYLAALSIAKRFVPSYPLWNKTLANMRYLYDNYVYSRAVTREERYAATVPEWEEALGENHFFIALWLQKYVKAAEDAEQYALAEKMWRKMLACWEAAQYLEPSARTLRRLECLHGIGRALFAQGNYADALAYFADCVQQTGAMQGRSHPSSVVYLEAAAEAARQHGDFKREARYGEKALQIRRLNPSFFGRADRRSREPRDEIHSSLDQ